MKKILNAFFIIFASVLVTSLYWHYSTLYPVNSPSNKTTAPNLSGIWQAVSTAHWDLEPHNARQGQTLKLGALGAIPAGLGVVEGGEIPYTPEALQQRNQNRETWIEKDPAVKCFMPGIPRANYLPFPFQIVQSEDFIVFSYEFASASRVVNMNQPDSEALAESWMGHSVGHWENGSLVIKVSDQVEETWFDSAGNFHSDQLTVIERFTPEGDNLIWYEAEIRDPEVFTRPWTMKLPLYRRAEPDMQLLEFKCVEFVEELLYGHLNKKEEAMQ